MHLELGIAAVNEVRVLDTVAVHERETVDVRLLGNSPYLIGRNGLSAGGHRCQSRPEQAMKASINGPRIALIIVPL